MSLRIGVIVLTISLSFVLLVITGCVNNKPSNPQGKNPMPAKTIEEVLREHTNELMSLPGVVGTAQGLHHNRACIKIYVVKKTPELDRKIPDSLEGYPVIIEETGEIRALPKTPK